MSLEQEALTLGLAETINGQRREIERLRAELATARCDTLWGVWEMWDEHTFEFDAWLQAELEKCDKPEAVKRG